MKPKKFSHEETLVRYIDQLLWMAARYAHGRMTYAPGMVREVVEYMSKTYPDWKPKRDDVIEPPKEGDVKGMSFRKDYLDDIFNPRNP